MSENLLRHETSPYLLQHKDNPVHWRPWGEAALAEARARDVPLLVSVGYSTCYWCHVMERESFEDEATAAVMNERFVCVKVDREERPDVDQLYMTAVQVQTRQGGWPMNVFLLPDGRYFYGGTYFPPREMHGTGGGRPSFTNVLVALSEAYKNDRAEVEGQAGQIEEILRKLAEPAKPERAVTLDLETLVAIEREGRSDFDERHGGFGGAPKFPRQTLLQLALRMQRLAPDPERERQIKATLDALAGGGIRDHLGGGFHRYSTDAKWLVPHFEIMLYDQAMLLDVFADAAELFDDDGYRGVARGIADFVLRDLTADGGGFFSGIDAEVNAREGQNYLWTPGQVRDALPAPETRRADRFGDAYGLGDGFNFADPHHDGGVPTSNVLVSPNWRSDDVDAELAETRRMLLEARARRDQPATDTKIITAWNALMIGGLIRLASTTQAPLYLDAARRAADFLLDVHRDGGRVMRTSKDGRVRHRGLLDDYAYLAAARLDLAEATGEAGYRDEAAELTNAVGRLFGGGGSDGGGPWFSPLEADDLYVRQKVAGDNPLPSGAAVYGDVLRRLGRVEEAAAVVADLGGAVVGQVGSACTLTRLAADLAADGHAVRVEASEQERPMTPEQVAEAGVQVAGLWTDGRTLTLTLAVAPGHHVGGVAAELPTVVNVVGFGDASVSMPDGETLAGNVEATVRFPRDMDDVAKLQLAVRYQLCRDDACLPPVTRTLNVLGPAAKTTACGGGGCGEEGCACVSTG